MRSSDSLSIHRRTYVAFLACALGLAGCGGGGSGTTTSGSTPPAATYTLAVDPNPLQVVAVPDTARAASVDLPLTGGTVVATGADGTVYTLTVPDGALAQPTIIMITPHQSVDVSGLGAERYFGAKFEPEGLLFLKPATLEITPPPGTAAPVDQQIPLAWSGTSSYVTLGLPDKTSPLMRQQINHFSSYGYALATKGTNASLAAARHRLGGDEEARIQAAVGEELLKAHQSGGNTPVDLKDLFKQYVDKVIRVRLNAAAASCANAQLAVKTYLGFERQLALMGEPDPLPSDLDALAIKVLNDTTPTVCMKEEFELCRDNHIITRIRPEFAGAMRQLALLGGDEAAMAAKLEPYVEKCLRFDVAMDSTVDFSIGQGRNLHTFTEKASTVIPVAYVSGTWSVLLDVFPPGHQAGLGLINGPMTTVATSGYQVFYADPCWNVQSLSPTNAVAGVGYLDFSPKQGTAGAPPDLATRAQVGDFYLAPMLMKAPAYISSHQLLTGSPATGGGCSYGLPETVVEGWNSEGTDALLQQALIEGGGYPELRQWQIGTGAVMGTKDWDITNGDAITGQTRLRAHFEIRHTPAAQ